MSQDVVIGYLTGDTVTQEFHHCLGQLFIYDMWGPRRIRDFVPQYSNVNICRSRNQMVRDFLAKDDGEWLWILDQDAVFPPNMLDRLLADTDVTERPIIGALAHQRRGKTDGDGNPIFDSFGTQTVEILPTMYQIAWNDDGTYQGYREITGYGQGLCEVDATGCHCLLVHRNVFEKIESSHPYRWFREDQWTEDGPVIGEDIWFCLEARKAGFPIYVDTRIEAGHVKRFIITSTMSDVEQHGVEQHGVERTA